MSEKYIVLNINDLTKFCDMQTREYVTNLVAFINRRRRETKTEEHNRKVAIEQNNARSLNRAPEDIKPPNLSDPLYFVLKLTDPFAMLAIEHYISRASESSEYHSSTFGLKQAVDHAIEIRSRALMFSDTKIPDTN